MGGGTYSRERKERTMQGLGEILVGIATIGAALVLIAVTPGLALVGAFGLVAVIVYCVWWLAHDMRHAGEITDEAVVSEHVQHDHPEVHPIPDIVAPERHRAPPPVA